MPAETRINSDKRLQSERTQLSQHPKPTSSRCCTCHGHGEAPAVIWRHPNAYGSLYAGTVRAFAMEHGIYGNNARTLLDAGANLDLLGPDKGTLLQAACCPPFEANEVIVALLEAGADLCQYDRQEESPLSMAIQRGYKTIAKTLVDAGAETLPRTEPKERS